MNQTDLAAPHPTISRPLVAVTGADGFIGSHLTEDLVRAGYRVRAMAIYNSQGSYGWLDTVPAEVMEHVEVQLGDVRDAGSVRALMRDAQTVYHLAALIAIPYSYVAPRSYVETNITGTLNVLEAARDLGTGRVVHTSTSEVYGTARSVPIHESHPLQGQSPYSATKISADKMCESYALSFGTPVTVLRPFNTFGPRQSTRAVIPTVLSQMLVGAEEIRLGAVSPKRDFTFVTDTADGFVRAALADVPPGEVIQLGTGRTDSIGEIVEICQQVTGSQARIVTDEQRIRPAGSEVEILLSEPRKAKELLGWEPTVSLEEGLSRVAEWLRPRVDADQAARYHR